MTLHELMERTTKPEQANIRRDPRKPLSKTLLPATGFRRVSCEGGIEGRSGRDCLLLSPHLHQVADVQG